MSVRYDQLIPMLLNELQKQYGQNRRLAEQFRKLSKQMDQVRAEREGEICALQARLAALEQAMRTDNRRPNLANASPLFAPRPLEKLEISTVLGP